MRTRTHHTFQTALVLGGVAVAVAACGSGNDSTAAGSSGGSGGGAVVAMATVGGANTLTDATGHTVYDAAGETAGHILCVGPCTSFWKPVTASQQQAAQASTALHKSFTVVSRPGGGTQLAYAGHPLYTFTQEGTHELRGNGFKDEFQGKQFTWTAALTQAPSGSGSSMSGGTGGSGNTGGGSGYGGGGYGY